MHRLHFRYDCRGADQPANRAAAPFRGYRLDQAQLDAGTALVTIGLVVEGVSAVVVWGVTIVVCARGAQFRIGIAASIVVLAAGVGVLSLGLTSLASMDAYR